jgi:uncharacterized membrane protein HdeD (DUF308 family)
VFATDLSSVVARIRARVTLVLPMDDADAPREWARTLAAQSRVHLSEPPGRREVIFASPAVAVEAVDPALVKRAATLGRGSGMVPAGRIFADIVRSVDRRIIARGGVSVAAGAALLSPIAIDPVWVGRGFAVWIAWSAISTILGAVDLRRESNRTWTAEASLGAVGIVLAAWMFLHRRLAVSLSGAIVVLWLLWHGLSDVYVAWRVRSSPVPRWTLWLQGSLALAIGVLAIVSPAAGVRFLRLTLGLYLVGSGVLLTGFGIRSWRRASRRVRELITRSREWTVSSRARE